MATRCRPAIFSHSLGSALLHDLPTKLSRAAGVGFQGIEVYYEDVEAHAGQMHHTLRPTAAQRLAAAAAIRALCQKLRLEVLCLQPFRNFEGLRDPAARAARLAEVDHWIELAHALGTDLIAICSSLMPAAATTGDPARLAADLAAVADAGAAATPPVRFTYEALCFGTHVRSWQQAAEVVRRAGRSNLGLCLDTFNLAGWAYADPAVPGGVRPDGAARLRASLAELVATLPPAEVFFVQFVDAQRLLSPLIAGHPLYQPGHPARMSWSRACRLFYGETARGAYLPIRDVAAAIFQGLGWRGWVSMELFSHSVHDVGDHVPVTHAARGMDSWDRLVADFPQITRPHDDASSIAQDGTTEGSRPSAATIESRSGKCSDVSESRDATVQLHSSRL